MPISPRELSLRNKAADTKNCYNFYFQLYRILLFVVMSQINREKLCEIAFLLECLLVSLARVCCRSRKKTKIHNKNFFFNASHFFSTIVSRFTEWAKLVHIWRYGSGTLIRFQEFVRCLSGTRCEAGYLIYENLTNAGWTFTDNLEYVLHIFSWN